MNSKIKTVLMIVGFIIIIGASYFAYQKLSAKSAPVVLSDYNEGDNDKLEVQSGSDNDLEEPSASDISDKPVFRMAPDFMVYDIDGNEFKLSDFKGKPTVVNFWASWCPPCKREMPDFNKVYLEMGQGVNFIMVDLVDGSQETIEDGSKFINEQGYEFPVYFDTDQNAAQTYSVISIPTTIFIDQEGNLVTGAQGAINEANLREGIQMAIEYSEQ